MTRTTELAPVQALPPLLQLALEAAGSGTPMWPLS